MPEELKKVWAEGIDPDDYDLHMRNVGQSEANAAIVGSFFSNCNLAEGSTVLFAGAGTGQMFDHVSPDQLSGYRVVFTDISRSFLDKLQERLAGSTLSAEFLLDDIEATSLEGPVGVAVLVLVLEHVDWRKALTELSRLETRVLLTVIQENPADFEHMIAPERVLPPTIEKYKNTPGSVLLDRQQLKAFLAALGYSVEAEVPHPVPDRKVMWELVFARLP